MFRALAASLSFFAAISASSADDAKKKVTVEDLAWMAGSWSHQTGDNVSEENWTVPRGGMMLATNRTAGGKKTAFEFLRIADTKDGVSYFAMPGGKAATEFAFKSLESEKITFENLKHDFPQRIIYWKADGKLHARIEGTVSGNERSMEWAWEKK